MIGFSLKLSNKRVDRIISNKGFDKSEVFYSPISIWFTFWLMLSVIAIPMTIEILFNFFSKISFQQGILLISIYLLICYLLIIIFNRSFAITEKDFIVCS